MAFWAAGADFVAATVAAAFADVAAAGARLAAVLAVPFTIGRHWPYTGEAPPNTRALKNKTAQESLHTPNIFFILII